MDNLDMLIEEFHFYSKARNLAITTLAKYRKHMGMFSSYLSSQHITELGKISTLHVRKFLIELLESGKSESYVNSHLKSIRGFFRFCEEENYITPAQNPCLRVKWMKETKKMIETFTDTEVTNMINAAREQYKDKPVTLYRQLVAAKDTLVIMILADTAIRCNELCQLTEDDFSTDKIFIRKGKGKKERFVFTSTAVAKQYFKYQHLKQKYFKGKKLSEYLIVNQQGGGVTVAGIEKMVKRVGKIAEVRPTIRCCPHDFRHYASQKMLRNSENIYGVSKILGHHELKTTMDYLRSLEDNVFLDEMRDNSPLTRK